ncbi:phage head completion protein [Herbidospora mongoliensis]|uniref:phage head completion protein n=1 Tax=Herbidospora mongoliensis TaxID=688067 RepID=UPI000833C110|nr:hypothetical protein [Herbidospora mongoliensis]
MIGHLLTTTAARSRLDTTADGGGGTSSEWVDLDPLPCKRDQPVAIEREQAGADGADLKHPVYFEPGDDVRRGDRLDVDGLALVVTFVYRPSKPVYLRADCRERQGEEPL